MTQSVQDSYWLFFASLKKHARPDRFSLRTPFERSEKQCVIILGCTTKLRFAIEILQKKWRSTPHHTNVTEFPVNSL